MRHTIVLSEAGEANLRDLARSAGQDENALLGTLADKLLEGGASSEFARALLEGRSTASDPEPPIRSTPNVMGGDACIRNIRIPVWMLVSYKQMGFSDERLLEEYPGLRMADLAAAWSYYAANAERVETERRRHEEAD